MNLGKSSRPVFNQIDKAKADSLDDGGLERLQHTPDPAHRLPTNAQICVSGRSIDERSRIQNKTLALRRSSKPTPSNRRLGKLAPIATENSVVSCGTRRGNQTHSGVHRFCACLIDGPMVGNFTWHRA